MKNPFQSYTGALVGPLVDKSPECRQHFALAIREALIYFAIRVHLLKM